jgi:nitrogen fixation NifU-like protein
MSETYTLYNPTVMDHFMNPRNMGDLKDADGVGEVGAAACGDIMKISLKIKEGKIEDARFKTFGCGSAIASSSMATELIKGRTVEEAMSFSNQEVVEALGGLPPVKIHCSVLAEEALKAALEDYLKKHPEAVSRDQAEAVRGEPVPA